MLEIKKDSGIGFCFGVRRAIDIVEKIARERGTIETLGAIVHNQPVLQKLSGIGVRMAGGVDDIKGNIVATSAHGVSPRMEKVLQARHIDIVSTTCPFVHRAQLAAQRLAQAGFRVVIYGDANHPEVEGVIGWANGNGVATLDEKFVYGIKPLPSRLGVLSQTTQIPAHFTDFVKKLVDLTFTKDSELCVIDTICHEIRERQASALELAGRVDLMLVIGGHNSANTNCLARLCSRVTRAYLVETADEIDSAWFSGQSCVGITGGTSAAEETINDVVARLESIV
ncbi:MAG: 4-hydroxy-3-methylbut-2-enyl diphosphate reductase [Dehalococcoidales bacterium]|nr:4-hydroxy-3-methylbut-2-enyl diphosphate reductase [Dehalococcoidales bacterium]